MKWIIIILIAFAFFIFFPFNLDAKRIRTIQNLLNKDRTICDVINSINGWKIDNTSRNGLRILINPKVMPIYPLYITYNQKFPTSKEIKALYHELTNPNSVVTKAHKMGIPVEEYLNLFK